MKDRGKTKEQLVRELADLRQRLEALEASDGTHPRMGETLADSEARYRIIVDTASEGVWVLDEEYKTTFVNKRMADMLGYEQGRMQGMPMSFFLFEEDLPDFSEKVARRRQGIAERYERRLRRGDGSTLWAHVSATPMLGEKGSFRGSFAMFTDITERKQAEEALLQSEAKYRSIFENAVEGIFQSTPEGELITVNPSMARIFGYASPEEMMAGVTNIGRQLYTDLEDRRAFEQLLQEHGIAGGFEAQFYRKDGTGLWGSLNVRAVKDTAGNLLCYEGTLEDITARKSAQEALRTSEEKYRNIFENAVMGMYQVTPGGRYLSVNPVLARIHGYGSPEEMMQSITDIAHQLYVDPGRRAQLGRLMEEDGFVKDFEIIMRRKDGSLHWVSNTARAIRGADGTILYYEGTIEDITSRKLASEELKQLRKTLDGTLQALSMAVEARDPGTSGHQRRVARLAGVIAREMGLPDDAVEGIETGGIIHDIGKVAVPAEILSKPGRLSDMEHDFVKVHARSGYDLLKDAGLPYPLAEIVLQHHERLDGSGYPQGLKGHEILLEARILAVADVVEAMLSPRPYRPACGLDAALEEIRKGKRVLYDTEAVDACLKLFRKKGFNLG